MGERREVGGSLGQCPVTEAKGSKHFKKEVVTWLSFVHVCFGFNLGAERDKADPYFVTQPGAMEDAPDPL